MDINQPSQLNQWTFRRVVWGTLVLVAVALCFWLLYRFSSIVFILFVSIVLGTVIRPIVTWLNSRGMSQMVAGILVFLLLLALVIGFLLVLYPLISEQSGKLTTSLPGYYQTFRDWMLGNSNLLVEQLGEYLPSSLSIPGLTQQTGEQILNTAGQALGYVTIAANVIFTVTTVLLLVFYWMLYGPRTIRSLLVLIPKTQRETIGKLVLDIETKVGYYILGQGALCLVIGIMALVAYLFIGLPNALLLALVAGVLEAVPMVGPLLGAVPAAIIALSIAPSKLIWVIVATLIIQQLENSLLVPRIMRKTVGVNPFVSLLSLFAFGSLLGIPGALMAIPIAAILQLILQHFVFDPSPDEASASSGRDYASRLRYEAQDLVQDLRRQARLKKAGSGERVKQIDQVMDEIETITSDLDALLGQVNPSGIP